MRVLTFLLTIILLSCAQTVPPSKLSLISSEEIGFGKDIILQETSRDSERSLFKITRNYDHKASPSAAWGTPHTFFVLCVLRKIGSERGATKVRLDFKIMGAGQLRSMKGNESFASVGQDQLYLQVEWFFGEEQGDIAAQLKKGIIPLKDDSMNKMCEGFMDKSNADKSR